MDVSAATNALEDAISSIVRFGASPEMQGYDAIRQMQLPVGAPANDAVRAMRTDLMMELARAYMSYHTACRTYDMNRNAIKTDITVLFVFMIVFAVVMIAVFLYLGLYIEVKNLILRLAQVYKQEQEDLERFVKDASAAGKTYAEALARAAAAKDIAVRNLRMGSAFKFVLYATFTTVCGVLIGFAVKWFEFNMKTYVKRHYAFVPEQTSAVDALFKVLNSDAVALFVLSMTPSFKPRHPRFTDENMRPKDDTQLFQRHERRELRKWLSDHKYIVKNKDRPEEVRPVERLRIFDDRTSPILTPANYDAKYAQLISDLQYVHRNSRQLVDRVRSFDAHGLAQRVADAAEGLQKLMLRENDEVEGASPAAPRTPQELALMVEEEMVPALRPRVSVVHHMYVCMACASLELDATIAYTFRPAGAAQDVLRDSKHPANALRGRMDQLLTQMARIEATANAGQLDTVAAGAPVAEGVAAKFVAWNEVSLKYTNKRSEVVDAKLAGATTAAIAQQVEDLAERPDFLQWGSTGQAAPAAGDGDKLTAQQAALQEFLEYRVEAPESLNDASVVTLRAAMVTKVGKVLSENIDHPGFRLQYLSVARTARGYLLQLYRRENDKGTMGGLAAEALETASTPDAAEAALSALAPEVQKYGIFAVTAPTDFENFTVFASDVMDAGVLRIQNMHASVAGGTAPSGEPAHGAVMHPGSPLRAAVQAWQPNEPLTTVSELAVLLKQRVLGVLQKRRFAVSMASVRDATVDGAMADAGTLAPALAPQVRQAFLDVLQDAENDAVVAARAQGSERFVSFDRFQAKVGAMRGAEVATQLLLPLQTIAYVGRDLDRYVVDNGYYFEQQALSSEALRLFAIALTTSVTMWMFYYTAKRFVRYRNVRAERIAKGEPPAPPNELRTANDLVDEIALRGVLVWAIAAMVIIIVFAQHIKGKHIIDYNRNLADYNARQLLSSSAQAAEMLLTPSLNGPAFDFGLRQLIERARGAAAAQAAAATDGSVAPSQSNLLNEPISTFQAFVGQMRASLRDPVRVAGNNEQLQRLYAQTCEVLRSYESGNALLLMRGDAPFPYVDVVGNGVLLALTLAVALFVWRTMNPFDNLKLAQELRTKIELHKRARTIESQGQLECVLARDARTYDVQKLTVRIVVAVVGIFFVITYITKVYRSGQQYGSALYGSPLYRKRMAYKLA